MTTEATQRLAARKMYGGDGSSPAYMDQEVLSWSPEKITLKTFDLFLLSGKKNDINRMNRVLIELMGSLNFEYEEPATRLYRIYEFCQRCIMQRNYDTPIKIIQELRDTWAKAHSLE